MGNQEKINSYFNQFNNAVRKALAELPAIAGNEAVNFALDNFKDQGYDGEPWQPRKYKSTRGIGQQPILVQSGALRRSIRVISSTATSVLVGSDLPYAAIHNNGGIISRQAHSETFVRNRITKGKKRGRFTKGTVSGQGHTVKSYVINMPQRRFLGPSDNLKQRIITVGKAHIIEAIKTAV